MTVSIIIAVRTWQKNLEECAAKCLEIDYPDFEMIILPDADTVSAPLKVLLDKSKRKPLVQVIPTGPVGPAQKRDIALRYAKGEILAFLDDDAYPVTDWLNQAAKNFSDAQIAAVGGPAATPESDSLRQKASGCVFASPLVSGQFTYRYLPGKRRQIDDYPSCNLLVLKNVFEEIGGFNTNFWPGEDTKLCLDIVKKLKRKIVYDPKVLVFHHRRPLYLAHIKQVASYGLHRGYFVKRYPETSLKPSYFIPSVFVLGLILGGIASLFSLFIWKAYICGLAFYLLLALAFSVKKNLRFIPLVFFGIMLTHFTYGAYFLKGLLVPRLKEE